MMETTAEQMRALGAFSPHASARAEETPIRVAALRALAAEDAPGRPAELGSAAAADASLSLDAPPAAFEVQFTGAPLAFDSVEPATFRVLAADGQPLPGRILLVAHDRVRLALDAPPAPGDYTVELVGDPQSAGGAAIRSHQGVPLAAGDAGAGNFRVALRVGG